MIEILFSESAAGCLSVAACNGNYMGGVSSAIIVGEDGENQAPDQEEIPKMIQESEEKERMNWEKAIPLKIERKDILCFPVALSIGDIAEQGLGKQREAALQKLMSIYPDNVQPAAMDMLSTARKNLKELNCRAVSGTLYDLQDKSTDAVDAILQEIIGGTYENGTKEQKIAGFYQSVADMDSRNAEGIAPIKPYLELIDSAETTDDLIEIQSKLVDELYIYQFMGFGLTIDIKDSTKYTLYFSPIAINLPKDTYQNGTEQQIDSYKKYMKTLFVLGGETEEDAEGWQTHATTWKRNCQRTCSTPRTAAMWIRYIMCLRCRRSAICTPMSIWMRYLPIPGCSRAMRSSSRMWAWRKRLRIISRMSMLTP